MADVRLSDLDWLPAVRISLEQDVTLLGAEEQGELDAVALVGEWVITRSPAVPPRVYPAHRVLFVDLAEEPAAEL